MMIAWRFGQSSPTTRPIEERATEVRSLNTLRARQLSERKAAAHVERIKRLARTSNRRDQTISAVAKETLA